MGQKGKEKERQKQAALAKKKITQSHQPPPKKEPTTPKSNLSSVSPSQTTELSSNDQTIMPIIRGDTPAHNQKEQQQHLSGISLLFIGVLATALIAVGREWLSARSDLRDSQEKLTVTATDLKQARTDRDNALAQHEILKLLGPDILSYQRYTFHNKEAPIKVSLGVCPALPCYNLKYEGIQQKDTESQIIWSVSGETESHVILKDITFNLPIRKGCYRKTITKPYTIIVKLLELPAWDQYHVAIGVVKTDPKDIPQSATGSYLEFSFPLCL